MDPVVGTIHHNKMSEQAIWDVASAGPEMLSTTSSPQPALALTQQNVLVEPPVVVWQLRVDGETQTGEPVKPRGLLMHKLLGEFRICLGLLSDRVSRELLQSQIPR